MSSVSPDPKTQQLGYLLSDIFLATVFVVAAVGFLLYGGRLIFMLKRFPIESRGRRKKLWEVGLVTSICAGCFTFRCVCWPAWSYALYLQARLARSTALTPTHINAGAKADQPCR